MRSSVTSAPSANAPPGRPSHALSLATSPAEAVRGTVAGVLDAGPMTLSEDETGTVVDSVEGSTSDTTGVQETSATAATMPTEQSRIVPPTLGLRCIDDTDGWVP